jgi:endonuclease/exonuclease/phosphatase (EEP) superfamily protein YafD
VPTALKWFFAVLGLISLVVCGGAVVMRATAPPSQTALVVVVFTPYVIVGTILAAAVLSIVSRQWWLAALTAIVAVISLAGQMSFYYFGEAREDRASVNLRVLSANIRYGEANPRFLYDLARDHADLIAIQELTFEATRDLSEAGIGNEFPYSVLKPGPGATGIGLWSRYPIERFPLHRIKDLGLVVARVRVPGVRNDVLFASVHVAAPVPNRIDDWRAGLVELTGGLDELSAAGLGGAVIVAGDYNSTPDMRNFRDLLTNGYQDAVDASGAGFAPTYPSDKVYPPVITIDHALIQGAAADSVDTVSVPGSDHRALRVNVHVPVDPTAS